ncbi:MAG: hypothetical protein QOD68_2558 [Actinomycetota bacterium]|jgi:hypothetical protein|nr:hypothetical protein [Actinomycetota bacterium]
MDRRWALGAVWALFAAASVGVGFAAAGLVGDPFSDPAGVTAAAAPPGAGSRPTSSTASPRPTGSSVSSPRPTRTGATADPEPTVRSVTTRGGFVAGSCRAGLVTVSASPAIGWQIKDVDHGQVVDARVRFEATSGDGRVEVHSWCSGGTAKFSVDDQTGGDDGGGSGSGSSGRGGGDG